MLNSVPFHWIWLVNIPIPSLTENSARFMESDGMLQGKTIDAVGTYSLQFIDYSKYELLCHYLTVI